MYMRRLSLRLNASASRPMPEFHQAGKPCIGCTGNGVVIHVIFIEPTEVFQDRARRRQMAATLERHASRPACPALRHGATAR